ncbi:MAG: PTS transporter subunit EIIA [Nitrospinaceae bacterium]|nr:PTS sugar transporter subunit IIA [Nitrospinaceae bacterium]NIR56590.1 PTS sugar transporter subunit IIA [Nitrospinaceae bacterium]NIS87052.1 PTS sugar transporter subunit IIA [Nitrospinaceae bacterium]NIT83896.1 PTS sugar transporter subunit IIA [Nitrospinaceae bacterium]NIU46099.1 PTS sugar transporter subunit IIA [Nitrospinaceae bacterium]
MKLNEILKEDFIIADLAGKNKESVVHELVDFLFKKNAIQNKEALFTELMEREKLGSTGIGENVAIPHAKSEDIDHILTLFGRSVEGLDFESLDKKPVHFVCLVIAPVTSTGHHLKALAKISRLLKSQNLREGILKAQNRQQIYSILLEEDSKFI